MKFALFLASVAAFAQTLTIAPSSPTVRPGQQVTLSVNLAGSPAIAALTYTLNPPAGWAPGTSAIGTAGTAASKSIQCGTATPRICVVYSLNNNLIGSGAVATIPFTVPASATPGQAQFSLSAISAGNAAAQPVTVTTSPLSITVLSLYDLDGNGIVDFNDLKPVLDQVTGVSSCSTGDFNGDGKCDSIDVLLLVVKGVLGL